jgi:mono/diheme cytochrome c family protein
MKKLAVMALLLAGPAVGAPTPDFLSGADAAHATGEQLYTHICQACHMPAGQGAVGAGAYPALAQNPKLAAGVYPVVMVLHGRGGMPAIGEHLTDAQVAAVVNYVRTHLGNTYTDAITTDQVKALRP